MKILNKKSPPPFKKTLPLTILPPPFLVFQIPPLSGGGNQNLLPPFKNKGGVQTMFMDGVQLPQGLDHFEKAVYFLPLTSQKCLVLILSTSKGWKAESTLEPPSSFENRTPGLGIQHLIIQQYILIVLIIFLFRHFAFLCSPLTTKNEYICGSIPTNSSIATPVV